MTKPSIPVLTTSQQAIHNILAGEFAAIEKPLSPSALGDLSSPIHPIFRAANFPDVKDYSVIAPSARLASLFLRDASVQPILRTILFHGPLIPLGENDNDGKPLYQYPADPRPVSPKDIRMIDATLDEFAEFVSFTFAKARFRGSAFTDAVPNTRPGSTQSKHLPGICSETKLSRASLDALVKATKQFARTLDTPLLVTLRFNLAVELMHEACHALNIAKDGHLASNDTEPFFPGAMTAEIGFAVEEALFGGHYTMLWDGDAAQDPGALLKHLKAPGKVSDLVGLPVVWNWPCTWTWRDYRNINGALWVQSAQWANMPQKDIAWRVPVAELAKYFTMAFWSQVSPSLRLPRDVGFAFKCDQKGQKRPATMTAANLRQYAPVGYHLDKYRTIIKT